MLRSAVQIREVALTERGKNTPVIKTDKIEAAIDEKMLTAKVRNLKTGKVWAMRGDGPVDIGIKGHWGHYQTLMFREALSRKCERLSETSVQATLTRCPYSANVWSPLSFGLMIKFTVQNAELKAELLPYRQETCKASIIDSFYPRGFMFPEKSSGDFVLL